jgi:hypothetical protein
MMITAIRGSERMEIRSNDYSVGFDPLTQTVNLQGTLRLVGAEEYEPITQLLGDAAARLAHGATPKEPRSKLTLNLKGLQFLNSSGINMLSKFVIKMRQQEKIQLIVIGNGAIAWQSKSLKNLQRLMPSLQLELE